MSWKILISPEYKKKDCHGKSNDIPVSILLLLSKPFEHILYELINSHTKDRPSKYQRGFFKNNQLPIFITSNFWKMDKNTR